MPDYREIDRDPQWHRWLLGVDTLTGRVRQQLLNDAIASGSDARVAAFFRGFQQEAGSTQASAPAKARARPSGEPVYTRDQIQRLYDQHLRDAYHNREAEWARQEADIIAAGPEGRIQNPIDILACIPAVIPGSVLLMPADTGSAQVWHALCACHPAGPRQFTVVFESSPQ